mmetsp:Transcript_3016/g.4153  ORF Transcript_3016/g.4153 Transcript_3016/m.4153 type:complete len:247 (+) Transcript_3016:58-798(+)
MWQPKSADFAQKNNIFFNIFSTMKFIQVVLILTAFILSHVLGDEIIDSSIRANTSSYYRDKFFITDEEQSCGDISDKTTGNRTVYFCSLPAPDPDTLTTLSFWGWQEIMFFGEKNYTGSISVYLVSENGEETLQLKVDLSYYPLDVKWYREDFTIINKNSSVHITSLKLYYSVSGEDNHKIHLRDVWVRATSSVSSNPPSRHCFTPAKLDIFKWFLDFFFILIIEETNWIQISFHDFSWFPIEYLY